MRYDDKFKLISTDDSYFNCTFQSASMSLQISSNFHQQQPISITCYFRKVRLHDSLSVDSQPPPLRRNPLSPVEDCQKHRYQQFHYFISASSAFTNFALLYQGERWGRTVNPWLEWIFSEKLPQFALHVAFPCIWLKGKSLDAKCTHIFLADLASSRNEIDAGEGFLSWLNLFQDKSGVAGIEW